MADIVWGGPRSNAYSGSNPMAGFSTEELEKLKKFGEGGDTSGSLSDLPLGYSFDRATNQVYRQTANGPVAVGREELLAATLAEKGMMGGGGGGATRQPQYTIDERTGQVVEMTPGAQVGFAGIDPRDKFAADENQRGFSNSMATYNSQLAARQQAIDQFEAAQNRLIQVAGQKEQGRQADLRAAVDQWQTAMNLIPQMGQLAIQESERVQGILQNGGDFLARAFESRGGASPLAKVTQADQINAIGSSLANLRNMVSQNTAGGPAGGGGYQAPQLDQSGGGFGGAGAPGPAPTYTPYQMPSAPAVSAPAGSAPVSPSSGGGGGFTATAPAYNAATDLDPWESPLSDTMAGAAEWQAAAGQPSGGNAPASTVTAPDYQSAPTDTSYPTTQVNPRKQQDYENLLRWQRQGQLANTGSISGFGEYAKGGYTTEPVFLGNEEGAELFINPTGAPIQVVDAKATKRMVPGFATGTMSGFGSSLGTSGTEGTPGISRPNDATAPFYRFEGGGGSWTPVAGQTPTNIDQAANPYYKPTSLQAAGPGGAGTGFNPVTQKELADLARSTAPPAVTAVLGGRMPPAMQALKAQDGSGETLPGFTARQLAAMTPEEIKALGTTTNTIFNAPLEFLLNRTQAQYGAKEGLQRGFLRGAGL